DIDLWQHWEETYWAEGNVALDTNGVMYDQPHNGIDLAASGLDITGAVAILNVGSFRSQSRTVNSHTAGSNTFTYNPVTITFKDKEHFYLIEGKLNLLDAEREWFYDKISRTLYLWAPGGIDPSSLNVRGKTLTYCFDVTSSDFITLKGLNFFGGTINFYTSRDALIEDCNFTYPSCSKRMLGVVGISPEVTRIRQAKGADRSDCVLRNCVFAYTDGHGIFTLGNGNMTENCYFHHIDYAGCDAPTIMAALYMEGYDNVFRQNTLHTFGCSVGYSPGDRGVIEYNNISDGAYVQHDGTLVQCMVNQQTNVKIGYNWVHDNPRLGIRFDGSGGRDGLVHHTVSWNLNSGVYIGNHDYNKIYNNFCIDSAPRNEIVIESGDSSNNNTITRNNAAEAMGATNTGSDPIPGIYDHNWNGYVEAGVLRDQVR
ncbi:MAG: right-handed parallel beta-helix repeat-containing protein, partial [Planctomycetes bacterium]|nr:right-handed parallel beta-helix repeat-containing protein [Planctomycetota bacterium]